ncbi:hypothetical protein VOLCADRAFT_88973 [Volvox carteri f. nagariensis]|uniref:CGL160/ATPI domain-containing protein n=1 Tax=Volvox carteri f. nagariensis TaxID=3068 RepID=D8TQG4_VOLCA|nr:uncharacterized protein VOLCADRAFT_88973 [Volvox carteri f. nagariensis]EFJ50401.1 hypothetical protein VOLCADRAFT_88973 [Volvox carteri f. nagariensis]|eukprot:XP_002948526.1 hypothetical protein VOLCADRAFT_88973 [Volvox carteri f. nagariensis]
MCRARPKEEVGNWSLGYLAGTQGREIGYSMAKAERRSWCNVLPCSKRSVYEEGSMGSWSIYSQVLPAASGSDSDDAVGPSDAANGNLRLPKRGYFSIADTNAEVYSRAGDKFDPAKKGGRYKPEFIWNTDWQTALEREESLRRKVEEARARPQTPSSGFLSLSRVADLDRMDVDLSEMILRKRKEEAEAAEAAEATARQAQASTSGNISRGGSSSSTTQPKSNKVVPVFTRKEAARLGRVSKSMARTAVVVEVPELDAEKARQAELERQQYEQLKVEQQVWTLAFSVAGFTMTYVSYSMDVAVSYVVGALGGFAYLRLLSKSVDAVGADGVQSGVNSITSQPRLLIPIILGLGYNRFNQLYSEQLGVHLELLPMLVGFFTYKLAVITRQYKDVFDGKV